MNLHLICILALGLLLNGFRLMAREIRQERLSLLNEVVLVTDRETFVLTGTPNLRQSACGEQVAGAIDGCRLPVVRFRLDSAELSDIERESMLTALALCTIAPDTGLIVTGHTCSLGTEDRNRALSQERAEQVAAVLSSHGYTVFEVAAMGSQQPLLGNEDLINNRRVELAVIQP
ncbi:MAG: OmpA family protein [Desulfobulbus sp.]|nr:OmpA family protein [Desulfobulbus sp.]